MEDETSSEQKLEGRTLCLLQQNKHVLSCALTLFKTVFLVRTLFWERSKREKSKLLGEVLIYYFIVCHHTMIGDVPNHSLALKC